MENGYRLRELKVEINRNCPLNCLHCSSNGMFRAPEYLEVHKLCELIREFALIGGEKICLSGGEPLLYEHLPIIIEVCRSNNLQTTIYTTGISSRNGSLRPIPDNMVEILSENRVKAIFSVHGASSRIHDMLTRVNGSFEITKTAIVKTIKTGVAVEIHVVPTALNIEELTAITALAASFDVNKISWLRFVPQGRGMNNRNILQLNKRQLEQLAERKALYELKYSGMKIRMGAPFNVLCSQMPTPCEAGLSVLTIKPDGSVSPCDAFKQIKLKDEFGNVFHYPLSVVWQKSKLLNTVRQMQNARANSSCTSCPLYSKCNAGCLAQKVISNGQFTDGRDPECLFNDTAINNAECKAALVC